MKKKWILFACLAWLLVSACDRTPVIQVQRSEGDPYKENMINANKYIASSEDTQIKSYVQRRGWNMSQLPNGEWLQEYHQGKGARLTFEDSVTVRYRMESLTGTVFYANGEETFVIGRHQTTVGLDRAVMELHHGSKARLILPSGLAYGVTGDQDHVPGRAVLVYDLEVL